MKKILKIIPLVCLALTLQNCEEDLIIYGEDSFVQLENDAVASVVENSGTSVPVNVLLGSPQASDVTVNFDITGSATASRYTLSSSAITIPAGETSGSISLTPVDNEEIDGDVDVILTLSSSSSLPVGVGGEAVNSVQKTITIVDDNVPCNDVLVSITTDRWGSENSWTITDDSGAQVASGGTYVDGPAGFTETYDEIVTLEDGCYTFTMFDSYGDGMGTGTYSATCGAIIHAQGGPDLANNNQSEATDFCVNQ
jgi:hypothetical protein